MSPAASDPLQPATFPRPDETESNTPTSGENDSPSNSPTLLQNFTALSAHQVLMRTGWIFKTESIVMPAVLDSIAGAGWIRGWLPLLNRLGHSLPPVLLARRIKLAPRKKHILFMASALMSALFLVLSLLFTQTGNLGLWMPAAFLTIYLAFFVCVGINQVAFSTLQGKLIATPLRGRLLLVSNTIGAVTAVASALILLPAWLRQGTGRFDLIFGFSGVLFALSSLSVLLLVESEDRFEEPREPLLRNLQGAWDTWTQDKNFRKLTAVAALFGSSMMLFPHYQNLGLRGMQLELGDLVLWVVVQNIGTGLFSVPAGQIADRRGNRQVLLIALLGIATAPLLAIGLRQLPAWGGRLFPLVFVFVGLTPVVLRTLQNFTLELSAPADHPRYLSTLALCVSLPMLLSPLVGMLVDTIGFEAIFLSMAAVVLMAWLLCFGLEEPREHVNVGYLPPVD